MGSSVTLQSQQTDMNAEFCHVINIWAIFNYVYTQPLSCEYQSHKKIYLTEHVDGFICQPQF